MLGQSKNMRRALILFGTTCLIPFSAHAAGIAAGTNVQNTFTLDYQVSGVEQPTIDTGVDGTNTPTEFTVDRLIDLTVASNGTTSVAPGAQDQELIFSLTNEGNDVQAYDLSVVNEGSDEFTAVNQAIFYYIDDGDETLEAGGDDGNAIAYNGTETPDLAADRMLFIVVQGDIPTGLDDEDDLSLVADTLEPSTAGASAGDPVVADPGGVNSMTGAAENVLADGTGTSNEIANAGDHSASSTFIVASADIAAAKAVTVFSEDGAGCATFPGTPAVGEQYSIPGACVQYVAQTFAARNRLTVSGTGQNTKAAEASDITHIRWVFETSLQPGERGQLSFKGTLK